MWYETSFRRHLCDMHIEDWDDAFLSKFSPEEYYRNLVEAKVQTAVLYFQSHVGYCYYPTKTGHMHNAFIGREDAMKRLVDLCHQGGMTVVAYYSVNYNNWAYYQHPEWRMVDKDGHSSIDNSSNYRYGLVCPNNEEYRGFVVQQIQEMADYFDRDCQFFDMLFWPHACYCPACRARWEKEVGGEIPTVPDANDPRWLLHVQKRKEWMGDFAAMLTRETKRITPGLPVEMNLAALANCTEKTFSWSSAMVNDACDYAGGDLYGGLLEQSFACKMYSNITKNQPYEYMTSRCNPNLSRHTITKPEDQLEVTTMITCAHHGAMLMIDAINPDGTMDASVYKKIGRVYEKEAAYEPYLKGKLVADAAIFYNFLWKDNFQGQDFNNYWDSINLSKTFLENHVPHGVVTDAAFDLSSYKFVFMPYVNTLSPENRQKVIDYVKAGGNVCFSGAEEPQLLKELLGGVKTGETEGAVTYVAPKKEYEACFGGYHALSPLPFEFKVPVLEGIPAADVLATVTLPYTKEAERKFASIHSNPPGIPTEIPAVVKTKYGKGSVLWFAPPFEHESILDYKTILMNLVDSILPREELSVTSDAPKRVELVTYDDKAANCKYVSAVQICEDDEIMTLPGFTIGVKTDRAPKEVLLLPHKTKVDFTYEKGRTVFRAKELHIFDMYQIVE